MTPKLCHLSHGVMLQGVERFGAGCCPRNLSLLTLCTDVDLALVAFVTLLERLWEEMSLYFGSAGANYHTRSLIDDVAQCWDFGRLAYEAPSVRDTQAFLRAYRMLRPCLRHTSWPDAFPYVARAWPSSEEMAKQYGLLVWDTYTCAARLWAAE